MITQPPSGQVEALPAEQSFSFGCGPEMSCFTDCCRSLDLALTPYDVLRLRRHLRLDSATFLERYAMVEEDQEEVFPQLFLAMVDDGRASCPFVAATGCTVYADRPAACRAYPMGRGLRLAGCKKEQMQELFILMREPHCRGFEVEERRKTPAEWMADQELSPYNRISDALLPLLRHPRILQGWRPRPEQQELYLQTLYQLDDFRKQVEAGAVVPPTVDAGGRGSAAELNDSQLLLAAIEWLKQSYQL